MDVKKAFEEVCENLFPGDRKVLGEAIQTVVSSHLLPILIDQIQVELLLGSPNDTDDEILQRVREARWQVAVVSALQADLANIEWKGEEDA